MTTSVHVDVSVSGSIFSVAIFGVLRVPPTMPSVFFVQPDMVGPNSGCGGGIWVGLWVAECVVNPFANLYLFLDVGVDGLWRVIVLRHGLENEKGQQGRKRSARAGV